jgi:hypothetical protein
MNDPRVEWLQYTFRSLEEHHDYSKAQTWTGRTPEFELTLQNDTLRATPIGNFSSEDQARTALEPFLRAWELEADLRDGVRIRFSYASGNVVDRNPTPGSVTVAAGVASAVAMVPDVTPQVGHSTYPAPPTEPLLESPFVKELLDALHEVRQGRQRLLVSAYLFQTRIVYEYGTLEPAAGALNISEPILRKLGELSVVNDPRERRKVRGPERPLSEEERVWITAALPKITLHIARQAAGVQVPQLTMADLPRVT